MRNATQEHDITRLRERTSQMVSDLIRRAASESVFRREAGGTVPMGEIMRQLEAGAEQLVGEEIARIRSEAAHLVQRLELRDMHIRSLRELVDRLLEEKSMQVDQLPAVAFYRAFREAGFSYGDLGQFRQSLERQAREGFEETRLAAVTIARRAMPDKEYNDT